MLWHKEKSLAPAGNRTPAIQPEAHHYTDSYQNSRYLNVTNISSTISIYFTQSTEILNLK
jgi:hypothetical protein